MVGCPLKCTYCPQGPLLESYGKAVKFMSLADFGTILGKVPKYVRIDFSGMSEPWANSQATDMLRLALGLNYHVAIYTTLWAMKDPGDVLGLLRGHSKQIETLCLHLPDRHGNMRGFKPSERYKETLKAFLAFGRDEMEAWRFQVMTMDQHGGVHESLHDVIEWIPLYAWTGNTRAGNVDHDALATPSIEEDVHHKSPVSCSYTPFYDQNVVLPNGDVVLCCMDYSRRHRIGNLLTGDYKSLFVSDVMTRLRWENQSPNGSSLCKTCTRAVSYSLQDHTHHAWEATLPPDSLMKDPPPQENGAPRGLADRETPRAH